MNDINLIDKINSLEERIRELENKFETTQSRVLPSKEEKKISIKEFLLSKKASNEVERTLIISYFLEQYEDNNSFNTDDLKKAFRQARQPLPLNINDKINMNIKKGHIMEAEEKKDSKKSWMVTNSGQKFVEMELNK